MLFVLPIVEQLHVPLYNMQLFYCFTDTAVLQSPFSCRELSVKMRSDPLCKHAHSAAVLAAVLLLPALLATASMHICRADDQTCKLVFGCRLP